MKPSKLFKAFLFLLPLLEIAMFIFVGGWIGVWHTLLLVILTTIAGFVIIRTQGFVTLMQMQQRLNAGEHPAQDAFSGALKMFAGFLLVLPGFITDTFGILLLFSPVRSLILHFLAKTGVAAQGKQQRKRSKAMKGRTIEGEFHEETQDSDHGDKEKK